MVDPIEIVFYIHGVSPSRRGRMHTPEYSKLHQGIAANCAAWPTEFGGAEWGWNHSGGPGRSHELLTDAQRLVGSRVLPEIESARDFTFNPMRQAVNAFRSIFLYNFSDMFYYVSADGKQAVRLAVGKQIYDHIDKRRGDEPNRPISITLLGHSAGSVVAFDFLFAIYFDLGGDGHSYVKTNAKAAKEMKDEMAELRSLAKSGMLRVRRLITFGSPITPLVFRSDEVVKTLASDRRLNPADYGLTKNPPAFHALAGPRWINIWDKDDPIAWPVESLVDQDAQDDIVNDLYIDVSDSIGSAHDSYWDSAEVHKEIARLW